MVDPFCQDTRNDLKLEPQPDAGAVSKYSSTTHETNEGDGVIQFSEMPPGNQHLLAAKPGAKRGRDAETTPTLLVKKFSRQGDSSQYLAQLSDGTEEVEAVFNDASSSVVACRWRQAGCGAQAEQACTPARRS